MGILKQTTLTSLDCAGETFSFPQNWVIIVICISNRDVRWMFHFAEKKIWHFAVNGRIHWGVYKEDTEPNRRQCNGWLVYAGSGGDTATQKWSSQKLELKGCSERGWWEGSEGLLKINHKKNKKHKTKNALLQPHSSSKGVGEEMGAISLRGSVTYHPYTWTNIPHLQTPL